MRLLLLLFILVLWLRRANGKSTPTPQPSVSSGHLLSHNTQQPTEDPTHKPSRKPTRAPSEHATSFPSSCPSMQPLREPSSKPSVHPSSQPSGQPSVQPRTTPSMQPSRQPSTRPTSAPSVMPTPSSKVGEEWWYLVSVDIRMYGLMKRDEGKLHKGLTLLDLLSLSIKNMMLEKLPPNSESLVLGIVLSPLEEVRGDALNVTDVAGRVRGGKERETRQTGETFLPLPPESEMSKLPLTDSQVSIWIASLGTAKRVSDLFSKSKSSNECTKSVVDLVRSTGFKELRFLSVGEICISTTIIPPPPPPTSSKLTPLRIVLVICGAVALFLTCAGAVSFVKYHFERNTTSAQCREWFIRKRDAMREGCRDMYFFCFDCLRVRDLRGFSRAPSEEEDVLELPTVRSARSIVSQHGEDD